MTEQARLSSFSSLIDWRPVLVDWTDVIHQTEKSHRTNTHWQAGLKIPLGLPW
jgi:hypothetical protein